MNILQKELYEEHRYYDILAEKSNGILIECTLIEYWNKSMHSATYQLQLTEEYADKLTTKQISSLKKLAVSKISK